jgi:ribose transport system permease protein
MKREEKSATFQPAVMERSADTYPGYGRLSQYMTWERIGLPAVILGLAAFFTMLEPRFLTQTNLTNIGRQVSILALASWGQTLVILSAGIDLSVGAVVALVSVVMGLTFKSLGPVPGIFAGLIAGALVGLFNGLIAGKTRVTPFVITLASLSIVRGLALTITGGVPVWDFPDSIVYVIGNGYFLGIPIPIYVAGIGFILVWCLLYLTPFGTRLYAVGGNEEAALLAGVNISRIKIAAYTMSGLLAGVGGVVLTLRVQSGQPLLGSGLELQTIAAVVIGGTSLFGGKGSLVGSLYGVIIIGVLANGLDILGVSSFVQQIIIGATTLGAVLFTTARRRM